MGKQTVVGSFRDQGAAEQAIEALRAKGFSDNEVSLIAKDNRGGQNQDRPQFVGEGQGQETETEVSFTNQSVADGTTWGAGLGAGAGLLASAGALAIPGVGPLLAMGPLAATLGGAAAGGLAGGLTDYGIPKIESKQLEEQVKRGETLALVEASEDKVSEAKSVLEENGAQNVRNYEGKG